MTCRAKTYLIDPLFGESGIVVFFCEICLSRFLSAEEGVLCVLFDSSALRLELAPIRASLHWGQQVHIMSLHGSLLRDIICGNRGL